MMSEGDRIRDPKSKVARRARSALKSLRARLPQPPRPAILMYHRIADETFDPWGTIVSPNLFAEQVAWLSEKRTVLRLTELADLQATGRLPPDAIAITFDDGYSCNAEIAAPILEKLRLPATIFLPVQWIERGEPYWWDEIQQIVFDNEQLVLQLGAREIPLGEKQESDREWRYGALPQTPRQAAFREIWLELILNKPAEIENAVQQLRDQFEGPTVKADGAAPMTPEQVRRTASHMIEFGSHALRHPALTSLSKAEQAHEISDSVGRCKALTGSRPTGFAYPFGIFDEVSEQLVRQAGFACACSVEAAAVGPASRTYALPRVQVGNWSAPKMKRALALL